MNITVQLLSGEVKLIEIFEKYCVYQLKNELIESKIIENQEEDLKKIILFNRFYEEMDEKDICMADEHYYLFVKEKSYNLTLEFKKDFTGGSFGLYSEKNKLTTLCGYYYKNNKDTNYLPNLIECNILFVKKLYKKAYHSMRTHLEHFQHSLYNYDSDNDENNNSPNEIINYELLNNDEICNPFIEKFVKSKCMILDKIVMLD